MADLFSQPAKTQPANLCGVEQSVARVAHNHEVAGSSPAPATILAGSTCEEPDLSAGPAAPNVPVDRRRVFPPRID